MLETTLSTQFIPGTNLKGQVAGANWSFLLPHLNLERIVCLGMPRSTTLTTLARLSREVIITSINLRQMSVIDKVNRKSGLTNIQAININGAQTLPLSNSSIDLVLIASWPNIQQLSHDRTLRLELQRLLKPQGLIYFEFSGLANWLLGGQVMNDLAKDFGTPQILWLTPMTGEMHTAVPLPDRETIDYFLDHKLYSSPIKLHLFDRFEQLLNKHLFTLKPIRRYGVLMASDSTASIDRLPQYLCSIAQSSEVQLDQYRWGLSAPSQYSTRKILFFLFNRTSGLPEYIIKMVRDPAFNSRLENEYRALSLLYEKGIGNREVLPQVTFFGHHNNLAIVGETMIEGAPFRRRTKGTVDCPYGRTAIDWLINLGAATADPAAATPVQVAEGLQKLFQQFIEIYQLTPEQHAFLKDQIAIIGSSRAAFPLVFQHGDPGTWNVMVTPAGRTAFLDWEAAEPQGMPLWDLFYFMRSYAVWAARLKGIRNSLKGFVQELSSASPLGRFFVEVTERYCEMCGLSSNLVKPLFYTCWMHRALKEATRCAPTRLESCHYVNLLRLCIEQRHALPFYHLFS